VRLHEFRDEVRREFGDRLERATPANVRNFLTRMQTQLTPGPAPGERIELNETATSFEEVITDFLAHALEAGGDDPEQALIVLWLLALELHFARVGETAAERLAQVLSEPDADTT
jgi:HEAT repeat protein